MNEQQPIRLSLIIPVFNRPSEVGELLESLCSQTCPGFEVIVVEDGSSVTCEKQVQAYESRLSIRYFMKPNSGPGQSRNYGCERAKGNYVVFLDSDCVIPPTYIEAVLNRLTTDYVEAFGGPDRAGEQFSTLQKAINYAMTSFFTTGGIRGGGEKLDKFYPRSFNMGYSKAVYEQTQGFSAMRFGEDIDMSIRILKHGFKTALIKDAFVYHKRRSNLRQFFKQVFNSGIARIVLFRKHPESLKLVHTFPSLFVLGMLGLIVLAIVVSAWFLVPLLVYTGLVLLDATIRNRSLNVGALAVVASFVQLGGYGSGFLMACWKILVLKNDNYTAFLNNFYK